MHIISHRSAPLTKWAVRIHKVLWHSKYDDPPVIIRRWFYKGTVRGYSEGRTVYERTTDPYLDHLDEGVYRGKQKELTFPKTKADVVEKNNMRDVLLFDTKIEAISHMVESLDHYRLHKVGDSIHTFPSVIHTSEGLGICILYHIFARPIKNVPLNTYVYPYDKII